MDEERTCFFFLNLFLLLKLFLDLNFKKVCLFLSIHLYFRESSCFWKLRCFVEVEMTNNSGCLCRLFWLVNKQWLNKEVLPNTIPTLSSQHSLLCRHRSNLVFYSDADLCNVCGSNTHYSGGGNMTSQLGRELFMVVCMLYGGNVLGRLGEFF